VRAGFVGIRDVGAHGQAPGTLKAPVLASNDPVLAGPKRRGEPSCSVYQRRSYLSIFFHNLPCALGRRYTGWAVTTRLKAHKIAKTQINPSIPDPLVERLRELEGVYDGGQTHNLTIALEYGLRHFKKAYQEYHELRKDLYQDADDQLVTDDQKVVKLSTPEAS
jgi:hypothetical protein